jgi:hypothetical protein
VVVDDPAVEAHHLVLDTAADGRLAVMQLTGRLPVIVDGDPAGPGSAVVTRSIEIGDSRLDVVPPSGSPDPALAWVSLGVTVADGPARHVGLAPDPTSVIGIVDLDRSPSRAGAVARSILVQVLGNDPLAQPELVLAAPGDESLGRCTAMLEIGARWRGRWTPDVAKPSEVVRLHVAGVASSIVFGVDRALVAEEVTRTVAELGGDVVGVPQAARGQRQAPAPDAGVELIAHARQHGDPIVELRLP